MNARWHNRPYVEILNVSQFSISPISQRWHCLATTSRSYSISRPCKTTRLWYSRCFSGTGLDESPRLGAETIGLVGIGREMALRFRRCSSGEHIETSSTSSASPGSNNDMICTKDQHSRRRTSVCVIRNCPSTTIPHQAVRVTTRRFI